MAHRDTDISRANGSQEIFSLIPVTSEAHHVTLLNVGKDLVETLTRNGGRVLAFRFDKLQGCRGFVFGSDRDKHVVQLDKNSGKGCLNLKHFQIDVQWEDGKLYVYDLGSSLGTHVRTKKNCSFVNAETGVTVKSGAQIQAGPIVFQVSIPVRPPAQGSFRLSNLKECIKKCKEPSSNAIRLNSLYDRTSHSFLSKEFQKLTILEERGEASLQGFEQAVDLLGNLFLVKKVNFERLQFPRIHEKAVTVKERSRKPRHPSLSELLQYDGGSSRNARDRDYSRKGRDVRKMKYLRDSYSEVPLSKRKGSDGSSRNPYDGAEPLSPVQLQAVRSIQYERKILNKVHHKSIIGQITSKSLPGYTVTLITEFPNYGNLDQQDRWTSAEMATATTQILKALNYLHVEHRIAHYRIEPSNILVMSRTKLTVKIANFEHCYDPVTTTESKDSYNHHGLYDSDRSWKNKTKDDIFDLGMMILAYSVVDGLNGPFPPDPPNLAARTRALEHRDWASELHLNNQACRRSWETLNNHARWMTEPFQEKCPTAAECLTKVKMFDTNPCHFSQVSNYSWLDKEFRDSGSSLSRRCAGNSIKAAFECFIRHPPKAHGMVVSLVKLALSLERDPEFFLQIADRTTYTKSDMTTVIGYEIFEDFGMKGEDVVKLLEASQSSDDEYSGIKTGITRISAWLSNIHYGRYRINPRIIPEF